MSVSVTSIQTKMEEHAREEAKKRSQKFKTQVFEEILPSEKLFQEMKDITVPLNGYKKALGELFSSRAECREACLALVALHEEMEYRRLLDEGTERLLEAVENFGFLYDQVQELEEG